MLTEITELSPKAITKTVTPKRIVVRLKASEAKDILAGLNGSNGNVAKFKKFVLARLTQINKKS